MSEIGIHAGGYQRVSDYARSVDRLLLDLQTGASPDADTVAPVLALLESMRQEKFAAPVVQLLKLQWRQSAAAASNRLDNMILDLKSEHPSSQTLADLEDLAKVLDRERVTMRLRLRGMRCWKTTSLARLASSWSGHGICWRRFPSPIPRSFAPWPRPAEIK